MLKNTIGIFLLIVGFFCTGPIPLVYWFKHPSLTQIQVFYHHWILIIAGMAIAVIGYAICEYVP